jgi:hypothetical protein
MSSENGCQTRLPPALRHKEGFPYQCPQVHVGTPHITLLRGRQAQAPLPLARRDSAVAQRRGELVRLAAVGHPGDEVFAGEPPFAADTRGRQCTLSGESVDGPC